MKDIMGEKEDKEKINNTVIKKLSTLMWTFSSQYEDYILECNCLGIILTFLSASCRRGVRASRLIIRYDHVHVTLPTEISAWAVYVVRYIVRQITEFTGAGFTSVAFLLCLWIVHRYYWTAEEWWEQVCGVRYSSGGEQIQLQACFS